MFSLLLLVGEDDTLIAELWEAGTAGIEVLPGGLRAFFEDDAQAGSMLEHFSSFAPVLRREVPRDWKQATRDTFPPLLIGERFFLTPSWNEEPTPAGRLRLVIDPGMACGTGWHPCTQLCLRAMEVNVKPGVAVLDVGSGSGILSEAARLLGAGNVVACDIDGEAVRLARERIDIPMLVGSLNAARDAWADVIVANISSAVAEHLAPELARVSKPSAALILSGFQADDLPELSLAIRERLEMDEWVCLVC